MFTQDQRFMAGRRNLSFRLGLSQIQRIQKHTFRTLRHQFEVRYHSFQEYAAVRFMTAYWEEHNAILEHNLLPFPPFSFLRNRIIAGTMVMARGGECLRSELDYLERRFTGEQLAQYLKEDWVGRPRLIKVYRTSHNSVHHLYHVLKFCEQTGCGVDQLKTIVEWGGGYGNFAKIFRRLQRVPSTYIIIDTPLMLCLQWLYLSTVLGQASVRMIDGKGCSIQPGKINLIPVGLIERVEFPPADLFVSTWALSESSTIAQTYVFEHRWFGAPHLLLAYQNNSDAFPAAKKVEEHALRHGASVEPINFLSGNYYAFV